MMEKEYTRNMRSIQGKTRGVYNGEEEQNILHNSKSKLPNKSSTAIKIQSSKHIFITTICT
jgi:hypothetical protein